MMTQIKDRDQKLEALQAKHDLLRDQRGDVDDRCAAAEFKAQMLEDELKQAKKEIESLKK